MSATAPNAEPVRWTSERRIAVARLAMAGVLRPAILAEITEMEGAEVTSQQLTSYMWTNKLLTRRGAGKSTKPTETPPPAPAAAVAAPAPEQARRVFHVAPGGYRSKPSLHEPQRGGTAQRICLSCGARFMSWGIGNRMCDGCRK